MLASGIYGQNTLYDYPNQLNCTSIPGSMSDKGDYFASVGSWFGISLPSASETENLGIFGGPFSRNRMQWLSKSLLSFSFGIAGKAIVELPTANDFEIVQYPGLLSQKYIFSDYKVEQSIIFLSGRTALYNVEVINTSKKIIPMSMMVGGEVFDGFGEIEEFTDGWMIKVDKKDDLFWLFRFRLDGEMQIEYSVKNYQFSFKNPKSVNPGDTLRIVMTVSQYFKGDQQSDVAMATDALDYPKKYLENNEMFWNYLIGNIINQDVNIKKMLVKCLQTLYVNMRSPLFNFRNFFFVEGSNIDDIYCDVDESWMYASSLIRFDPKIALHQLVSSIAAINPDGSLPAKVPLIKPDSMIYSTNTKPMAAWTYWNIYSVSPDTAVLRKLFPLLENYHRFWYQMRDVNRNLWCEDINGIETVELNAMLFTEKYCLQKMAAILGFSNKSNQYLTDIEKIKADFNNYFFDAESLYYCDFNVKNQTKIVANETIGYCLWSGLASWEAADVYAERIAEDVNSNAYINIFSSSDFDIYYYYFLLSGLKLYKQDEIYQALLFDLSSQVMKQSLNQPFKSYTGFGKNNIQNSSLTAATLLMLLAY
jgi:putative isomerase